MDIKRMLVAMAISLLIMLGWQHFFAPKPTDAAAQNAPAAQMQPHVAALAQTVPVTVKTDVLQAVIDEKSGDLRGLTLLKYNSTADENKPFVLFENEKNHVYVAQSQLLDENGKNLLKNASFTAAQKAYELNGGKVEVRLSAPESEGIQVDKVYTFTKGSYVVDVRFDVKNNSGKTLKVGRRYDVLRDGSTPEGEGWFMHSYTGPVLYTPEGEFQKVAFSDLDDDFKSGKDAAEYQRKSTGGYVGMIQHYFMSAWLMQPAGGANVCADGACRMDIQRSGDLYRAGVNVAAAEIQAGAAKSFNANLFAGPQVTSVLKQTAEHLELAKDYGRVHIFASPLFALLNWLHGLVGNWGWAIVLLTVLVKIVLFPLNNSAYKSMAKMRTVAPKMEAIKAKFGDDRMGMQQAIMKLYKDEKINPLGGCLPMLIQMPIFIGLYWMIFLSVELRQAPWMGWIADLSRPDHFYILPILMAATMWYQTTLNPPPTDPTQARMMKIMPLAFSVMFFFFPAGLVLYYVVNNLLTIVQQKYVNNRIAAQTAQGQVLEAEPVRKGKAKK